MRPVSALSVAVGFVAERSGDARRGRVVAVGRDGFAVRWWPWPPGSAARITLYSWTDIGDLLRVFRLQGRAA
jgi:hypothetical protein